MTERDNEYLRQLATLDALDASERAHEWWWQVSEAERDFTASLSAGAAEQFDDPERLYSYWRGDVTTEMERLYIEDLIDRVGRHLAAGTHARRVR